jgi:hypothetical protein
MKNERTQQMFLQSMVALLCLGLTVLSFLLISRWV